MNSTMEIRYSCAKCGASDRRVLVPYREPGEDVVAWMQGVVGPSLARDHDVKSPRCRATNLTAVKIPLPAGTDHIGEPPKH